MREEYTNRDYPFPDSSSTPVVSLSNEPCTDPNDPEYWKKNIVTNEDNSIKVPITQPGIHITEFAERLIALEQENVVLREEINQLRELISFVLSISGRTLPVLSQYYGNQNPSTELANKWMDSVWDWAKNHGVDKMAFAVNPDGLEIISEEGDNDDSE